MYFLSIIYPVLELFFLDDTLYFFDFLHYIILHSLLYFWNIMYHIWQYSCFWVQNFTNYFLYSFSCVKTFFDIKYFHCMIYCCFLFYYTFIYFHLSVFEYTIWCETCNTFLDIQHIIYNICKYLSYETFLKI